MLLSATESAVATLLLHFPRLRGTLHLSHDCDLHWGIYIVRLPSTWSQRATSWVHPNQLQNARVAPPVYTAQACVYTANHFTGSCHCPLDCIISSAIRHPISTLGMPIRWLHIDQRLMWTSIHDYGYSLFQSGLHTSHFTDMIALAGASQNYYATIFHCRLIMWSWYINWLNRMQL